MHISQGNKFSLIIPFTVYSPDSLTVCPRAGNVAGRRQVWCDVEIRRQTVRGPDDPNGQNETESKASFECINKGRAAHRICCVEVTQKLLPNPLVESFCFRARSDCLVHSDLNPLPRRVNNITRSDHGATAAGVPVSTPRVHCVPRRCAERRRGPGAGY